MSRNAIVAVDLGDGSTAVCCLACLLALYRGRDRAAAGRAARRHACEPLVPLGRPGRGVPPQPVPRRSRRRRGGGR